MILIKFRLFIYLFYFLDNFMIQNKIKLGHFYFIIYNILLLLILINIITFLNSIEPIDNKGFKHL